MKRGITLKYEIVNLTEKTVAGLTIRTSNQDSNMTKDIGVLWQKFFANDVYQSIPNKSNGHSIGLYTNYENDVKGAYDVMACCEVNSTKNLPNHIATEIIPAGNYAKFIVHGDVQKAVSEFWTKLWSMDLDRKYSSDFEEYQSGSDMSNAEIHIYISLK